MSLRNLSLVIAAAALVHAAPTDADAASVTVEIRNLNSFGGLFATPLWFGVHDGSFDLYDRGAPASAELERIAEDGDVVPLSQAFQASGAGVDSTVFGAAGPIATGETARQSIEVTDPTSQRYFSYATMVLPSNDAFIANGDPFAIELFDAAGKFVGPRRILVTGNEILDAGTEENDEFFGVAFLNQTAPDQGTPTVNGVVESHPGFVGSFANPGAPAGILGGTNAAGAPVLPFVADFTADEFAYAEIVITPLPAGVLMLAPAILGLAAVARHRRAVA